MFREQSLVRHLSYEEVDMLSRALAELISSKENVRAIKPFYREDSVISSLLANYLGVPLDLSNGTSFSLYSEAGVDYCFFEKSYSDSHYNTRVKGSLETIDVDEEGRYQKVTLPWIK